MLYTPVPATASGSVEVPELDGTRVRIAELPEGSFTPDGITLTAGSVTGSALASLGLGSLVISGGYLYYLLDFAAIEHVATPEPTDASLYTVAGVGMRIGFRSVKVSGNASFNLGGLAASATLKGTATSFEAQTVGVGLNMGSLPFVQALINQSLTSFNVGTLQQLGSAFGQLSAYLNAEGSLLSPKPLGVVIDAQAQLQSVGTSYGYALRAIQAGDEYLKATASGVNGLPPGVQRLDPILAATYASVLSTTNPEARPSQGQRDYAAHLGECGP